MKIGICNGVAVVFNEIIVKIKIPQEQKSYIISSKEIGFLVYIFYFCNDKD